MRQYFKKLKLLVVVFGLLSFEYPKSKNITLESAETPTLTGEWVITEQTISPLKITSLCKPIRKGATFKFTPKTLEVYVGASGTPCDVYAFRITNNKISFIKEDMIWLCTYELNPKSLKLKSNSFFTLEESDKSVPIHNLPSKTQEIVVTLKKK